MAQKIDKVAITFILVLIGFLSCQQEEEETMPLKLMGDFYSYQTIDDVLVKDNSNFQEAEIHRNIGENVIGEQNSFIEGVYTIHLNEFGRAKFDFVDDKLFQVSFMPRDPERYLEVLKDSLGIDLINRIHQTKNDISVMKYYDDFYIHNIWVVWRDLRLTDYETAIPGLKVDPKSAQKKMK